MMQKETWTAADLSAAIREGQDLLLLDCRDVDQYNASHVTGALLLTIPSIILRRMQKTGRLNSPLASIISCADDRERFARCSSSHRVVVYEHGAATAAAHGAQPSVSHLLVAKLQEDGCRVCLLQGKL